ncbi:MAG: RNA methyltransferase [Clostridia bacterium]|nr:RNA methyltransferase [Clostridia bacterium]
MEKITSAQNAAVKRLKSLNDIKARKRERACLVEGEVMIGEALGSGLKPLEALFEEETPLCLRLMEAGAQVRLCTRNVLESACDTVSPQGCCASFQLMDRTVDEGARLLLALDGVQDPGNLGTILRTMDAAGFAGAFLSEACADVYSPKVQRSAMGSAFRMPTQRGDLTKKLTELKAQGFRIVVSDLSGGNLYESRFSPNDKLLLVIGNEARGVSEPVKALSDIRVKIPMRGRAESLNAAVAAGILMYELTRP